jgi:hypothetical protein
MKKIQIGERDPDLVPDDILQEPQGQESYECHTKMMAKKLML